MGCSREEICRAWLTYGHLGAERLTQLLEDHDCSAEAVYDHVMSAGPGVLSQDPEPEKLAVLMKAADADELRIMALQMEKHSMRIMSMWDPIYPDQLLNIPDPPPLLFWRGDPDCLSRRSLTFVGSRHASVNALQATEQLTEKLSRRGVTIVSGMAQGIDQAAHRGCLMGTSPTIAVLGCGLDIAYPSGSLQLKRELLDKGGVLLSEYHPGARQRPWFFPTRNRILSGLSRGTVMMECGLSSGSMTTIHHALDQGRDVFAWPGIPGSPQAQGAHRLLREGAIYFTEAQDLLEDMDWMDLPASITQEAVPLAKLPQDQRMVCVQLRKRDMTLDELAFATELDTPVLSAALTLLQLQGYVRSLPGKTFHLI